MTKRVLIMIGLLLELLAVFAVFLQPMYLLGTGTRATVRTIPVDPRSIFRGDYVILDYEAAQGLPLDWDYNKPVYVVLEQNGDVYERVTFTGEKPTLEAGQICIRGTPEYMRANFRDIGQYFVPEGEGMELENAQRTHRLLVDIATDASCRAGILGVRLGAEAPLQADPRMMPTEAIMPAPVEPKPVTTP